MMEQPLPESKPQRIFKWFNKTAVFVVALILTVAIILQGNFLEGLLKLLGVGASQMEQISITSADDFFGRSNAEWLASFESGQNRADVGDTAAFNTFSRQPYDPGAVSGFVMPLWSGSDPSVVVSEEAVYVSPVIDLGNGGDEIIDSIEVLDYQPETSRIIYQYRVADSLAQLDVANYQTLELANVGELESFTQRRATLGLTAKRYLQFKIAFSNFSATNRPMVAEFNINHGPAGEAGSDGGDMVPVSEPILDAGVEGDLNNDGVINTMDYAEFLQLWEESKTEDTPESTD